MFIGVSQSEPHTNHSYEKIAVPMYVCSVTSSTCSCTYRKSVKIVKVHRVLTLIVAHQSRRIEQQHEQPASYSRERLREQLFERLEKQTLLYNATMIIVSIINDCGSVLRKATATVLNLYWALCLHVQHSAADCY